MNRRMLFSQMISLTLALLILVACSTHQPTPTPMPPTAVHTPTPSGPDNWPTKGWQTSTPEKQGMDSEILANLFDLIQQWKYDIHSVTVIRNGYMVVDATFYPFSQDTKHYIQSCTKSISSALIGIAIEQQHIDSVQQPVLSFFPERTAANLDVDKENMTLEHLLMMASGLECRDSINYNWRGLDQMIQTDDWVQFMLDLPMAEPPGTRFEYCNGASFLLSAIIQETTGMTASNFAEKHLFGPLGIHDVVWPSNPQGITSGMGGLRLKPHDMAKIGYLFLNEGQWDDAQIIPADWVEASTRKHISVPSRDGYGYQWWIGSDGEYSAQGYAGQYIFVVPEHELVVAVTSNLDRKRMHIPATLLDYFILAIRSSTPLPPNPAGLEILESKIQEVAQNQTEPEPVPPLPEIAQMVTGQTYLLDPNPRAIQSVSLTFHGEAEALFYLTNSLDESRVNPADPEDWWSDVEWPVGLDGIYRFSPGQYGIHLGMKGWWESEETFVIYIDYIGNTHWNRIRFTFRGEQITIEIMEDSVDEVTSINRRLKE